MMRAVRGPVSTALVYVVTHFFSIVLISIGLTIVGLIVGFLAGFGVSGWIIGPLAIVGGLVASVGGVRWGNQHGSGTTGGFPLGIVIAACIGVFGWLLAVATMAALLLLPIGVLPWMFEVFDVRFDPPELAWLPMLATLLVSFAVPLTIDLRSRA